MTAQCIDFLEVKLKEGDALSWSCVMCGPVSAYQRLPRLNLCQAGTPYEGAKIETDVAFGSVPPPRPLWDVHTKAGGKETTQLLWTAGMAFAAHPITACNGSDSSS